MPALAAIWALELADRLDQADHWLLRLMEEAQRRQSPSQFMLAASARADVSCRRGALADAEQDATTALELARSHGRDYSVYVSAAALTMALTEQGRLAEAEVAAAEARDSRGAKCDLAIYVCCRGWLRIAQGRPVEALAEFQTAGSLAARPATTCRASGPGGSGLRPPSWRSAGERRHGVWLASSCS